MLIIKFSKINYDNTILRNNNLILCKFGIKNRKFFRL